MNKTTDSKCFSSCLCLFFCQILIRTAGELLQTAEVLKLAAKDNRHKAWENSRSISEHSKSNDEDLEENQDQQDQNDEQHDGNFSRWQNFGYVIFSCFSFCQLSLIWDNYSLAPQLATVGHAVCTSLCRLLLRPDLFLRAFDPCLTSSTPGSLSHRANL